MTQQNKLFQKVIKWEETDNPIYPLEANIEGNVWKLRLNDFPEEPLYTLLIDSEEILDFDDMPPQWR